VKKYLSDNNIAVLKWPGNSPDLNPIENLWAIIKKERQKYDCTTTTKLIGAIISIWYRGEKSPKRVKNWWNLYLRELDESSRTKEAISTTKAIFKDVLLK